MQLLNVYCVHYSKTHINYKLIETTTHRSVFTEIMVTGQRNRRT